MIFGGCYGAKGEVKLQLNRGGLILWDMSQLS